MTKTKNEQFKNIKRVKFKEKIAETRIKQKH